MAEQFPRGNILISNFASFFTAITETHHSSLRLLRSFDVVHSDFCFLSISEASTVFIPRALSTLVTRPSSRSSSPRNGAARGVITL